LNSNKIVTELGSLEEDMTNKALSRNSRKSQEALFISPTKENKSDDKYAEVDMSLVKKRRDAEDYLAQIELNKEDDIFADIDE
jgi:hypothetical protein